jgi:hypothetical protein
VCVGFQLKLGFLLNLVLNCGFVVKFNELLLLRWLRLSEFG